MRTWFSILFVVISCNATAQLSFKTLVPQKAVVEGESFQVQYILQDAKKAGVITVPSFKGFRYVSGPNIYFGTAFGSQPMQNVVYTLEAVKPGVYTIPAASVPVNGKTLRSNEAQVEVISREEALSQYNREYNSLTSAYFLKPGEDPYKKIKENLFLRVMVDKTSCLVGEPILATFKLYSRLESKSDVVKNPGLYGFTVHDMVNLADREVVNEKINGKDFDVHTIRKVQLYPLQSGDFIVDPMEIKNRVEFSVSAVDKRTEQEVVEGILGNNDHDVHPPGTQIFETSVSTPEIKIHVSPLPEKNKPASYTGAVGSFRINARAVKPALLKNEEGFIEIIISGTGNFIQVDAPEIRWPTGLEGFQPKLRDQLDKMNIPLRGSRSFIYPFVALSAGNFTIPAVHFNFFDPDSNHYRQVQTDPVTINISNEAVIKEETIKDKKGRPGFYFIAAILLAGIGLSFILFKKYISSRKTSAEPAINQGEEPALDIAVDEPGFYSAVYHAVWQTAAKKFALQGSKMNKEILKLVMSANNVPPDTIDQLLEVIRQCEIGMFTGAVPDYQPSAILQNAREIIREIKSL